jgi:hypothetical protein
MAFRAEKMSNAIDELETNRAYWQNRALRYHEAIIMLAKLEPPISTEVDKLIEMARYILED